MEKITNIFIGSAGWVWHFQARRSEGSERSYNSDGNAPGAATPGAYTIDSKDLVDALGNEVQFFILEIDAYHAAGREFPGENGAGERGLQLYLDCPFQGPGPVYRIKTGFRQLVEGVF